MHFHRYGWSEWLTRPGGLAELLRISPAEAAQFERQLLYLGWNSGEIIGRGMASAADILQWLLETRLALRPGDRDMVVMLHEIRYRLGGRNHEWQGSLVVKGTDAVHTAMAQTVGLPLGIAALLLLQGRISLRGLHIPTVPEIYEPVLDHLEAEGIAFRETD
jgi:saccharopine dehydrogenase (NADP+, L-glutamate forming)